MWNPNQGQYMMTSIPPALPQVPWMSMGPSSTWSQPQYHWAVPQQNPPPQAASPPPIMTMSSTGPPQVVQTAAQTQQQNQPPVTTTTVTTTIPAGGQAPTTIPATLMNALSVRDAAGNLQLKIANHVPQSIKNKVWQYQYVDLGSLINTDQVPDELTYDFFPDHDENKISFKPSKPHGKITNFIA